MKDRLEKDLSFSTLPKTIGSIHGWGTKKRKKDLRAFKKYFLQITFI
jgi:hypothetical protein